MHHNMHSTNLSVPQGHILKCRVEICCCTEGQGKCSCWRHHCAQDWHQPDTAQATNRGDQHAKQPSQARTRAGQTGHHQVVGGVVAVAVLGRVQHLGALGVIQASPPPHIQNKQSCQQTQQHDAAYHNSCRKAKSQAAAAVQQQGHAARKGCQLWWCTRQCL